MYNWKEVAQNWLGQEQKLADFEFSAAKAPEFGDECYIEFL